MKNMKRFVALALVIVSVLAIAAPAFAANFDNYLGTGTLKKGARGTKVMNLQIMLVYAGYDPGPIDNIFGDKTEAAVKRFQAAYGIKVDGIVGKDTRFYLSFALNGEVPPGCRISG